MSQPLQQIDPDTALRRVVEGTSAKTGRPFFRALACNLAQALDTSAAWVTEFDEQEQHLSALGFWLDGDFVDRYDYAIAGTPCEKVVRSREAVHIPENVVQLYPGDNDLDRLSAVSFLGMPLLDVDEQTVLGHLAVLDRRPLPAEERALAILRIFAARASAELRRVRAEAAIAEREQKLSRLLDGVMDAVVEIDSDGTITLMNRAGERIFGIERGAWAGKTLAFLFPSEAAGVIRRACERLDPRETAARSIWFPSPLEAQAADGERFDVEATLACYTTNGRRFYTLVLRDLRDRERAQRTIQALAAERAYLREQLGEADAEDGLIGRSHAIRRVREQIAQVAGTDATVLIHGETGTGKELVARAIHCASHRSDRPLIKVNCAAVPGALIESEFFGHEKGAFTGATQKREGRFALADGGTIFLDEIGELPLELQAKLLRVLQEGEFEPVGSARTQKVNVRVVAATNRDLSQAVRDGTFREDLYYRLNVFPIYVPPLRERRGDVALLAEAFASRAARRLGRRINPIDATAIAHLEEYRWPGNVRELQNVIERAVITACDGALRFEALDGLPSLPPPAAHDGGVAPSRILTAAQLQELERSNVEAALVASGWRISGKSGAADRLGMPPSTVASRMKALGIRRPS